MAKNIIFYRYKLKERVGGPGGYLAILQSGLINIGSDIRIVSASTQQKQRHLIKNILLQTSAFKWTADLFDSVRRWNRERLNKKHVNRLQDREKYEFLNCKRWIETPFEGNLLSEISNPEVTAIHVHTVFDACKLKNTLVAHGLSKKILLTTHTPESCAVERDNVLASEGATETERRQIFDLYTWAERQAFLHADYLVYPSAEALDPLYETIPDFESLIAAKPIFYVPTGSGNLDTAKTRAEARQMLCIPADAFVVSFIGRHIGVKGYDILQAAALKLRHRYPMLRFCIAGKPLNLHSELKAPYWTEYGYIDPSHLLRASDCFVLPNRRTFYDLVLLEALSVGVPIVASATGGNKSIARDCPSLKTFSVCGDPVENLVRSIEDMVHLPADERDSLGRSNAKYYQSHHTPEVFARHYEEVLRQIQASIEQGRGLPS